VVIQKDHLPFKAVRHTDIICVHPGNQVEAAPLNTYAQGDTEADMPRQFYDHDRQLGAVFGNFISQVSAYGSILDNDDLVGGKRLPSEAF
jgi:hypothetical protein